VALELHRSGVGTHAVTGILRPLVKSPQPQCRLPLQPEHRHACRGPTGLDLFAVIPSPDISPPIDTGTGFGQQRSPKHMVVVKNSTAVFLLLGPVKRTASGITNEEAFLRGIVSNHAGDHYRRVRSDIRQAVPLDLLEASSQLVEPKDQSSRDVSSRMIQCAEAWPCFTCSRISAALFRVTKFNAMESDLSSGQPTISGRLLCGAVR
jgi:hypothetical protein